MDEQHVKELDKSIDWIFKRLRRPPLLWHLASSITIATVGFLSKVITGKVKVLHGSERMNEKKKQS